MSKSNKIPTNPLSLIVKSDTANLVYIRNFIEESALKYGFDDDITNKIVLAVDEACVNIIKHAYKSNPDNDIKIVIDTNDDRFEVSIIDSGISFNPDTVNILDGLNNLSKYKKGGLGMYLMKSLVDKVEYIIQKNNSNMVKLVMYKR